MAASQNSNLYREYIGAMFTGVRFTDMPINPNVDVHFILSFAIDYTNSDTPSPTNGQFHVYWDSDRLTPQAVSSIKRSNKNVKVALSLGGGTIAGEPVVFKAPSGVDSWVSNAVTSLTSIIEEYGLDGIDIDYENFDDRSDSVDTFVECIGQLITTLKKNGVISFASIAPFDDPPVQSVQKHYMPLWQRYSRVIDYVNFQFYGYDSDTTVAQFLKYYDQQLHNYNGGKVLASFSTELGTDGNHGLLPANGFFNACRILQSRGKLPGIFAWCADTSLSAGFAYEKQAQELLAHKA